MKRGNIRLWLLRDLPALIGVAWSFWPLMILVISSGRRAMRGRQLHRSVYDALMQMLPIAEASFRFALHRQAYRALGWNPRAIALDQLIPVASWSEFSQRFEAYRLSLMDLHAVAAYFTDEHRRVYRIHSRVDANAVRAAHASTDAARCAAATHELDAVCPKSPLALMLNSAQCAPAEAPARLPKPESGRASRDCTDRDQRRTDASSIRRLAEKRDQLRAGPRFLTLRPAFKALRSWSSSTTNNKMRTRAILFCSFLFFVLF
jgi:hypothetical protein